MITEQQVEIPDPDVWHWKFYQEWGKGRFSQEQLVKIAMNVAKLSGFGSLGGPGLCAMVIQMITDILASQNDFRGVSGNSDDTQKFCLGVEDRGQVNVFRGGEGESALHLEIIDKACSYHDVSSGGKERCLSITKKGDTYETNGGEESKCSSFEVRFKAVQDGPGWSKVDVAQGCSGSPHIPSKPWVLQELSVKAYASVDWHDFGSEASRVIWDNTSEHFRFIFMLVFEGALTEEELRGLPLFCQAK